MADVPQLNFIPAPAPESNLLPSANGTIMRGNSMQSPNYVPGSSGWRIRGNGDADFQNVTVNNIQAGGVIEITVETTDDLQAALDKINTAGGGTLRLSPGTYTVNNDLIVYDNTYIEGGSSSNTTLDFNSQAYSVIWVGTDLYSTGTLSVNQGSTAVTGVGVTWTSAMIGRQIFINNRWYIIVAVPTSLTLTLATGFADANVSAVTYQIANPINNIQIRNVTIQNSTTTALEGTNVREVELKDVTFLSNNVGMILTNFMNIITSSVVFASSTSHGYQLTNGTFANVTATAAASNGGSGAVHNNIRACTFVWSSADSNTADGYNLTDVCSCLFKLEIAGNGSNGIEFVSGCDSNFINDTLCVGNTSDGIKFTGTCDSNTIGSTCNITFNGAYGINIAAADCDNNGIIAPFFTTNTSGNIDNSGTGTIIINRWNTLDEDDLVSDSATALATQQSIKKYVDDNSGASTKQYILTTDDTTGPNDSSENTVFTTSILANTLGTNNGLKGQIFITNLNLGTNDNVRFRIKYGSTTVTTLLLTNNTAGNLTGLSGTIDFSILADGNTAKQDGFMSGTFGASGSIDDAGLVIGTDFSSGTATEDSTGALNLVFTVDLGDSSADDECTFGGTVITIIK